MNNFLLFIGALLVVTLAALFAVPHFVDWNVYRATFETQASKLVGRDVRVGGRVSLRLLPAPYVSFENVRVADVDGRFSTPPLRVEAFTLWLSIPPLLRGAIEASEVDLRRPEILIRLQDGNKSDGSAAGAAASVLPVGVALRSVAVHDGVVLITEADGREIVKLEKVAGEFSAPSLRGPFRFRGTLLHAGREREVRVATGVLEADGGLSLEGTARLVEQGSVYQIKGRASDVMTSPFFLGDLTVKPTTDRAKTRQSAAQSTQMATQSDLLPFYEVKSRLRLSSTAAQFDDLVVQFEQAGVPQTLSGSASAAFSAEPKVTAALDARWLDLDHIGGSDGRAGPRAALGSVASLLWMWLPSGASAEFRLGVEQATLGGDTVQRIELLANRAGDAVRVTRLAADVPGGRVAITGVLSGLKERTGPAGSAALDDIAFEGPVHVHGQSLKRFLTWIAPGKDLPLDDTLPFGLHGQLSTTAQHIAVTQLRAELGSSIMQGSAALARLPQPVLTLTLESDRLDLRPFGRGESKLADLKLADLWRSNSGSGPSTPAPSTAGPSSPGPAAGAKAAATQSNVFAWLPAIDADVRLTAGRLLLADADFRNVLADVRRAQTGFLVRNLRFATDTGLKFQADGQLSSTEGRRRGVLKTFVEVTQPASLAALVRFVDLPEAQILEGRSDTILPLRLAGIVTFGGRGGTGFEVLLDGAAQDSRASVVARLESQPEAWRTGVLDLTSNLENAKASRLLAQLVPGLVTASPGGNEPARLSIRANGVPKTGISTAIELESKVIEAGYSGSITGTDESATLTGEVGLKAADVADGLRLAGLMPGIALQGRDLVLHAHIATKGREIQVTDAALRLGSASAQAHGRIVRGPERLDVDLKATATEASLPALLAVATGTGTGTGPRQAANVWADEVIDLGALGTIGGKVHLEAGALALGQTFVMQRATLDAEFAGATIDVKALTGDALGGRVTASARIDKVATGVAMQGTAKLDGARMERLAGLATAQAGGSLASTASGTASGTLSFQGKGLTPRGIIGTLTGQGSLELSDVSFPRFGPEALDDAIAQALPPIIDQGDEEPTEFKVEPGAFKPIIAAALAKAPLVLGARSIPLELADGTLRSKALAFDVPRGRIKAATYLDLSALRIDGEWMIESIGRLPARAEPIPGPGPAVAGKAALKEAGAVVTATTAPGVGVVLAGPLADIASLEPKINADALSRELMTRRIERDLEAIERYRRRKDTQELARLKAKDDADKARMEAEKAKVEAERLKAKEQIDGQERAKATGREGDPLAPIEPPQVTLPRSKVEAPAAQPNALPGLTPVPLPVPVLAQPPDLSTLTAPRQPELMPMPAAPGAQTEAAKSSAPASSGPTSSTSPPAAESNSGPPSSARSNRPIAVLNQQRGL